MKTNYDEIASAYADPNRLEHPIRRAAYARWLELCGILKGIYAHDLGCGAGCSTEMLARNGAAFVWGIDKFANMIRQAQASAKRQDLGNICYLQLDMFTPLPLPGVKLVTAVLSLHYAQKKEEIDTFFMNVSKTLDPEGKFVALMMDPENPIMAYKPGCMCESRWLEEPFKEGSAIEVDLYGADGNKLTSVIDYHWNTSTYESLMKNHGLTDIGWIKDGILLDTPLVILTAKKKG